MVNDRRAIPVSYILELVDTLHSMASGDTVMDRACLERAHHYMDLLESWRHHVAKQETDRDHSR